jgi:NAD(P)-dependent dehydrogenase (short-subunit alcohol dehydrogenase family)
MDTSRFQLVWTFFSIIVKKISSAELQEYRFLFVELLLCSHCAVVIEGMNEIWDASAITDQSGRRVLVTGANSGIGYPAAYELARNGATVILACRDSARGEAALARLKREAPGAQVELGLVDLASLESVRTFAAEELARGLPLDLLINNAGVMAPPKRLESADGFELQFGTNVLGHFALTGLLLPALERAAAMPSSPSPRIVMLASIAHKQGRLDFDDPQATRSYSPMRSYQQTKLADLMLAFEMDRRLKAAGSRILANAAHPGVANTNLFQTGDFSPVERSIRRMAGHLIGTLLNSDAEGALPTLYAAVAPGAVSGGYYGPQGFLEMRGGDVGEAKVAAQARDQAAAVRLWSLCEELTGVSFLDPA